MQMKLSVSREEKKRPYLFGLMAVILVGIVGLWSALFSHLIMGSQANWGMLLLLRMSVHFISPFVWIGAGLIVIIWLAVMIQTWRV